MTKLKFTGTATEPQQNRIFRQFDQCCNLGYVSLHKTPSHRWRCMALELGHI